MLKWVVVGKSERLTNTLTWVNCQSPVVWSWPLVKIPPKPRPSTGERTVTDDIHQSLRDFLKCILLILFFLLNYISSHVKNFHFLIPDEKWLFLNSYRNDF